MRLPIQCEQYRLDNGLRVVLAPGRAAPTAAVAVYYDVGSRDEQPGRTGFAHLFEHMMFEGSDHVGKFGHIQAVQAVGGVVNGTTSPDRTNYYQSGPANCLELFLWLEADRMRSLKVTRDNFDNQRETVKEERRQSYDNRPYAKAWLRINELAYASFAYAHPTIGSMEDLDAAPIEAVQAFFRAFYLPNNALVSLAGDFDPAGARALIERHFGAIPSGADPPRPGIQEPEQRAEKRERLPDPLARLPAILQAWHIPPARSPDSYPLELLATALGDGRSSRLPRSLIDEHRLVSSVEASRDGRRGPDLFNVTAFLQEGASLAEVEALIDAELAAVARDGLSPAELDKAKNRVRARYVFGLQTHLARALRLAEYALYWGDPALVLSEPDLYLDVTAADVARVAATYMRKDNRTTIEVVPAPPGGQQGEALA